MTCDLNEISFVAHSALVIPFQLSQVVVMSGSPRKRLTAEEIDAKALAPLHRMETWERGVNVPSLMLAPNQFGAERVLENLQAEKSYIIKQHEDAVAKINAKRAKLDEEQRILDEEKTRNLDAIEKKMNTTLLIDGAPTEVEGLGPQ